MKYYELQGVKADSFLEGNLTGFSKKVLKLMNKHNLCPKIAFCDETGKVNPHRRCYDTTYFSSGQWYVLANDIILTDADTVIVSERLKQFFGKSDIEGTVFNPVDTVGDIENLPSGVSDLSS